MEKECRSEGVLVCIQSSSRNEKCLFVLLVKDHYMVKIDACRITRGKFPDMPCMKRVKKKRMLVGTCVSSQEQRARFFLFVNRW